MKKLMIAAVAAVATSVLFAEGTIESSNIVGYVTPKDVVAANTFTLGTSPFTAIGSDFVKVQDMMVPNVAPCSFSQKATKALQLQVWSGSGYKMYYYVTDAYIEETDSEVTGWADGNGDYTNDTIAPGTGYWYRYPTAASSFTLPGQVPTAATVTKNVFSSKFNLIGNPYPTNLDFSKVTTTVAPCSFSQKGTKALQLQVWNGSGYKMYYYVSDAYVEEKDDEFEGWADGNGDMVGATTTDVSFGMWAKCGSSAADGTITFAK